MSFLPNYDLEYLQDKKIPFEERICQHQDYGSSEQKILVIKDYELPKNKYDNDKVDIGILIPVGYPNAKLDMFYCLPPIKLKAEDRFPTATEHLATIGNEIWQQWSRHFPWDPNSDGICTILKIVCQSIRDAK